MTEHEALLILNAISGLGSIRIRKLCDYFGSFANVLGAKLSDLKAIGGIPQKVLQGITSFDRDHFLKNENRLLKEHGVEAVSFKDEAYPDNLKNIPDAPVVLYVKGRLQTENDLALAVVGSRRASFYGLSLAEKFSRDLSVLGITVVSGMARGIDTAAHQGALKSQGKTIAVLGSGLSVIYPPENKKLFEDIARTGAVVSEFSMATPPVACNFPQRNRIISGLSLGVIVVEAAKKSGALITSQMALEQGREVFAIPGKVDSPNSQGVHMLIKQGAKLTHSIEDILEELSVPFKHCLKEATQAAAAPRQDIFAKNLSADEMNIYNRIHDSAHIDDIAMQSGCSCSTALSVLLKLELKHLVRQLPGRIFVKTNPASHN